MYKHITTAPHSTYYIVIVGIAAYTHVDVVPPHLTQSILQNTIYTIQICPMHTLKYILTIQLSFFL